MSHTLEEIRSYWNSRAEGYTQSNQGRAGRREQDLLGKTYYGGIERTGLRARTGCWLRTWIFSVLLAKMGHEVTAIDYTENMLTEARKNAEHYGVQVHFQQMDAQQLDFEDNSFDLVISRNVLWNLENPEQAL